MLRDMSASVICSKNVPPISILEQVSQYLRVGVRKTRKIMLTDRERQHSLPVICPAETCSQCAFGALRCARFGRRLLTNGREERDIPSRSLKFDLELLGISRENKVVQEIINNNDVIANVPPNFFQLCFIINIDRIPLSEEIWKSG